MPAPKRNVSQWYLIQCKARQDERAELNLKNQNFTCYRPVHTVERLRHGKRVRIEESLFPGYMFIHLSYISDNWYSIRSTRGVLRLVGFDHQPTTVAPEIIHAIKTRSEGLPIKPILQPGDRVRIVKGPFNELEAIFTRQDGMERAVLLLNLLHRQQHMKVPLHAIEPMERLTRTG
ncbi:transcription/translation regulatory transformer protein RfaH [Halopseudomonas salina]|uniref:Transcription antitermination protein RfaH n=1 Tax=Halopseudomonas salina TaxID=1323744 RepID=A0ABQ1PHP3_9GAMM|nr:transcription/translation regulatory transformer protein RfaH [Halopseudomonas salina]GGC97379.1 transcription antitermination protein RfaH [Halopseudomonas salina]